MLDEGGPPLQGECPYTRRERRHKDTGEWLCETGVMQPEAKGHQEPQRLAAARKDPAPEPVEGAPPC